MTAITSSTQVPIQVPIVRFFDSFYSDQSLGLKVAKVFLLCLAVVVASVIFRVIKAGTDEGDIGSGDKKPGSDCESTDSIDLEETGIAKDDIEPVIEGKLWIDCKHTALIGSDTKCRFGKTVQLTNGQFLQVAPTDLYVQAKIQCNGEDKLVENPLPSSLFVQARQGDQVSFRRDGKLYRLTLAPSSHDKTISFDAALRNVEDAQRISSTEFIHTEDVPASYKPWGKGIFLSPETRQVVVGQKGAKPIDLDTLQVPRSSQNSNLAWFRGTYPGQNILQYQLFTYGQSTVTILVDRHHLYVHTVSELIRQEGDSPFYQELSYPRPCRDRGKTEYFFHGLLAMDGNKVDTENIEAVLNNSGKLTINIPFLA